MGDGIGMAEGSLGLATAVAAELGLGWASDQSLSPPTWFRLVGPDGLEISGYIDSYHRRVEYRGEYPIRDGGARYGPSDAACAGVAIERPAKAHAAAIALRVLPEYRRELPKALAAKEQDDWDRYAALLTLRHLGALLGEKPFGAGSEMAGTLRWEGRGKGGAFGHYGYGDVSVAAYGAVRIDLRSLPPAVAELVVSALGDPFCLDFGRQSGDD